LGFDIEENFPNIFWTLYVMHTLNLALQGYLCHKSTMGNLET